MSLLSREAMLVMAINRDDEKTVRQMLKAGVNPNAEGGSFDEPVIVLAARRPPSEILGALIEAGADINARANLTEETPLMAAAHFGYRENIEFLLEKGVNAALKNASGQTAAGIAENLLQQNYLNVHSNALNGALTPDEKAMIDKWEYLAGLLKKAESDALSMTLKNPVSIRKPLTFRR
jgi:ankyrin repeat protein